MMCVYAQHSANDDWREQLWAHNVAYIEVVDMLQFGSEDVKGHKWFRTIVWDEVYHKKLKVRQLTDSPSSHE